MAFHPPSRTAVLLLGLLAAISTLALDNATAALMSIVPVLTVYVGTRSWPILRDAGRYGDFSYGFYLWAWPMQQLVIVFLGVETPVAILLALSAAGALAIAIASWHLVEAPSLRFKPRKPASQPAPIPAIAYSLPAE